MSIEIKVRFNFTDAPSYMSNVDITREGDVVTITTWKRNGNAHAEAEISAKDFFRAIDKLKDD
jgi:hypothetical protein